MTRLFDVLPCVAVAWGVLAIGGVYPWAYYPLLAVAFVSGMYELWRGRRALGTGHLRAMAGALALLTAATSLQLVPLSQSVRRAISPSTDAILQQYIVGYAARAASTSHPLSIDPGATAVALMFIVVFGVFLLGLIVRGSRRGADDLVVTVTAVGAAVAIAALVQRASGTEKVYGLWQPYLRTAVPYGPFVNRNHFAGWMLMALPFILGSGMQHLRRDGERTDARRTLIWLGSRQASWVVLAGGIALVMGLALALSLSRSGAATLVLIMCLVCGALLASGSKRSRLATAYAVFFLVVAFGWGGSRELGARFADASRSARDRIEVWKDAARVARAFPIAGTGLNTYGTVMLFYQQADAATHYAQAHNDYLQLAAEGGALVGIPALLLLATVGVGIRDRVRRSGLEPARAGAIVGVVAILLQETADFSLQMPGNAVLFCVLCAETMRRSSVAWRAEPVPGQTAEVTTRAVKAAPRLARDAPLGDDSSGDINLRELDSLGTARH